jgi:hypothetical protein
MGLPRRLGGIGTGTRRVRRGGLRSAAFVVQRPSDGRLQRPDLPRAPGSDECIVAECRPRGVRRTRPEPARFPRGKGAFAAQERLGCPVRPTARCIWPFRQATWVKPTRQRATIPRTPLAWKRCCASADAACARARSAWSQAACLRPRQSHPSTPPACGSRLRAGSSCPTQLSTPGHPAHTSPGHVPLAADLPARSVCAAGVLRCSYRG